MAMEIMRKEKVPRGVHGAELAGGGGGGGGVAG